VLSQFDGNYYRIIAISAGQLKACEQHIGHGVFGTAEGRKNRAAAYNRAVRSFRRYGEAESAVPLVRVGVVDVRRVARPAGSRRTGTNRVGNASAHGPQARVDPRSGRPANGVTVAQERAWWCMERQRIGQRLS